MAKGGWDIRMIDTRPEVVSQTFFFGDLKGSEPRSVLKKHIHGTGVRLAELHCFRRVRSDPTIPVDSGGQNCFGGDMGRKAPIVVRKQWLGAATKNTFKTVHRLASDVFESVWGCWRLL